jgi:hypothetical protein
MAFEIPGEDTLKRLSANALEELRELAVQEHTSLRASLADDATKTTEENVAALQSLVAFVGQVDGLIDTAEANAAAVATEIPARPKKTEVVAANTPVDGPKFGEDGTKDVASQVSAPTVAGTTATVVEATVTAASAAPTIADLAPYVPTPAIEEGTEPKQFSIIASATLDTKAGSVTSGAELDWTQLAEAFQSLAEGNKSLAQFGGPATRQRTRLASIRREATADRVILGNETSEQAYEKLRAMSNGYGKDLVAGRISQTAANGFCTPSTPIYDTCSPITATGLLNAPRMVVPRGGVIHNQGLDFADFFGDDFVLPIPGHNILTEAQVIADTAKTCFEIPCPPFVDDRLNIAALCLTGSILQNRTYPEFVSTFVQGSIAAMAHLVNREIIAAIVTGSTAVTLSTVDPWVSDGTVLSQLMSAVEMAVWDLRYIYRTDPNQVFTVVLPLWIQAQLRADYLRQNARVSDDLADSLILSMFRTRGALVQYVYDWQDAFAPGAIPAANQAGSIAAPILSLPFNVSFLIYLPGTWVVGELDIIRLDLVYDSTLLAQNQVTQLFMEDGWKPMRMCQHSRVYTVNICPNGSTGVQRAVTCTDIIP